jgi:chromosome segregation and condensation protein ScpB
MRAVYIMRGFIICMLHQILLGGKIKEDEMGGACSMYGIGEKFIRYFGWENCREETTRKT